MDFSRRDFLKTGGAAARGFVRQRDTDPVYHFLNRISYGVRKVDLDHATAVGIAAYLEEQLDPENLPGFTRVKVSSLLKVDRLRLNKSRNAGGKCRDALVSGAIARAVSSPAQLYERMVEFWSDHFNIFMDGLETELVDFQREVIRKNALGNFKTLLIATARHPAMIYFLNNNENVAEHPNQNYARELMELHTIGVDGGYTEMDVMENARVFTGWTVNDRDKPGGFFFNAKDHDDDAKMVLGVDIPAGQGVNDGIQVLNMLADKPACPRFICRKLAVRFVSDSPPQSLIDAMVATWTQTAGEIKPVLRTLFLSPEFAASVGQKLRRPFDYYVAAIRATGTQVKSLDTVRNNLEQLGQIPYNWLPPNGYPDTAAAWANTNGLMERWNTAQALTDTALNDRKSGMKTPLAKAVGKPTTVGQLVDTLALMVFAAPLADDKRQVMIDYASDNEGPLTSLSKDLLEKKLGTLTGLMLSAPAFQWR